MFNMYRIIQRKREQFFYRPNPQEILESVFIKRLVPVLKHRRIGIWRKHVGNVHVELLDFYVLNMTYKGRLGYIQETSCWAGCACLCVLLDCVRVCVCLYLKCLHDSAILPHMFWADVGHRIHLPANQPCACSQEKKRFRENLALHLKSQEKLRS